MIVIVPAEALERLKGMLKLLNFVDALYPDDEKSQIFSILTV